MELATDGSFMDQRSSWSVAVIDDHLRQYHLQLPADEKEYSDDRLREVSCLAGEIPLSSSTGIFMAELAAVYRALVLLPVAASLRLWIDSQSVITAIARYVNGEMTQREKLRRPLLELIRQLIAAKQQYGISSGVNATTVQLQWQPAHTDHQSLSAVANRIADYRAKRAIGWNPLQQQPQQQQQQAEEKKEKKRQQRRPCGGVIPAAARDFRLPLILGEEHVAVLKKVGDQQQLRIVSGDIRREARQRLWVQLLGEWRDSRSQSAFAAHPLNSICSSYWRAAVSDSVLQRHTRFMLRAFTDTVHFVNVVEKRTCSCLLVRPVRLVRLMRLMRLVRLQLQHLQPLELQ